MLREDEGKAQGPHSECAMSGCLLDSCPGLLIVPHLTSLCPQQPDSGAQGLCRNWTPGPPSGAVDGARPPRSAQLRGATRESKGKCRHDRARLARMTQPRQAAALGREKAARHLLQCTLGAFLLAREPAVSPAGTKLIWCPQQDGPSFPG